MISQLHGIICSKSPLEVEVNLHGMVFEVLIPTRTYETLGAIGEICQLFTHLIWREDQQYLVGFHTAIDRAWFRRLIKISGVGSKVAIAILSSLDPQQLCGIINTQNSALLTRVPGIGKKTAERILLELSDEKTKKWMETLLFEHNSEAPHEQDSSDSVNISAQAHMTHHDVHDALSSLGYHESEINKALKHIEKEGSLDKLLRQALSYLSGLKS